jgi:hypothetical protein
MLSSTLYYYYAGCHYAERERKGEREREREREREGEK